MWSWQILSSRFGTFLHQVDEIDGLHAKMASLQTYEVRDPERDLQGLSNIFEVAQTKYGGRGCFALEYIPQGSVVLRCSQPLSSTIIKPFRKEVCQYCFNYNNGNILKFKESAKIEGKDFSLFFCSEGCQKHFNDHDLEGIHCKWLLAIEKHYAAGLKKPEVELVDPPKEDLEKLAKKEWALVDAWELRKMKKSKWLAQIPRIDEMQYMDTKYIVGVLFQLYKQKVMEEKQGEDHTPQTTSLIDNEISLFLLLQSTEQEKVMKYPYLLYAYIDMYKFIKLTAPECVQEMINPDIVRTILGKNLSNAFGIWSDAVPGEEKEYFGYAVFPSASYFNHSCSPNLKKVRVNNTLEFITIKDISREEEMCIDYGNFLDEPVQKRRLELKEWFFDCGCTRCEQDLKIH